MAFTIPVGSPVTRIKYKGVFDYNKLTSSLIGWCKTHNYNFTENSHKHKSGMPHGFEIEREINAAKKIDDFRMEKIKIYMHMWNATEVDAVKEGRPVKMWSANAEITVGASIDYDYAGKWEGSPFYEKLLKFYVLHVIKKDMLFKHADPLYYKCIAIHDQIKRQLGMEAV